MIKAQAPSRTHKVLFDFRQASVQFSGRLAWVLMIYLLVTDILVI